MAGEPYQYINSVRTDNAKAAGSAFNINYKSTLDSAGSELVVNADYVRYTRGGVDVNENVFLTGSRKASGTPMYSGIHNPARCR